MCKRLDGIRHLTHSDRASVYAYLPNRVAFRVISTEDSPVGVSGLARLRPVRLAAPAGPTGVRRRSTGAEQSTLAHRGEALDAYVGRFILRRSPESSVRPARGYDFVTDLPAGCDTSPEELGNLLSGSQRGRLAINGAAAHGHTDPGTRRGGVQPGHGRRTAPRRRDRRHRQ